MRRRNGHRDKTILADIVRRVVEVAAPERILLFGSAARGEMVTDRDIDLLVIKAECSTVCNSRRPFIAIFAAKVRPSISRS